MQTSLFCQIKIQLIYIILNLFYKECFLKKKKFWYSVMIKAKSIKYIMPLKSNLERIFKNVHKYLKIVEKEIHTNKILVNNKPSLPHSTMLVTLN